MKLGIAKLAFAALAATLLGAGCSQKPAAPTQTRANNETPKVDPLAIVLSPQAGETKTDQEIRQRQEQIRAGKQTEIALERLGWLFVAKARESFDTGFYKLAEQCAAALNARQPHSAEALLLRAHVLQNLHRFQESEVVAPELVAARAARTTVAENYFQKSSGLAHLLSLSERKPFCTVAAQLNPSRAVAAADAGRKKISGGGKLF